VSHPETARAIERAIKYAVETQTTWLMVSPKEAMIVGMATLTIVPSSTTMNVLIITVKSTNQGYEGEFESSDGKSRIALARSNPSCISELVF
jgi:hypothetical protein